MMSMNEELPRTPAVSKTRRTVLVLGGIVVFLLALAVGFAKQNDRDESVAYRNANGTQTTTSTTADAPGAPAVSPSSTTAEMAATTNPSVPRVGEPPDTSIAPGDVPNEEHNPAVVGIDPCKVFSESAVAKRLGSSVSAVRPTGGGTGCEYVVGNEAATTFLFSVTRGDSAAKFEASLRDVRSSVPDVETLTGIGNEAYVYTASGNAMVVAESRTDTLRERVILRGAGSNRDTAVAFLTDGARALAAR